MNLEATRLLEFHNNDRKFRDSNHPKIGYCNCDEPANILIITIQALAMQCADSSRNPHGDWSYSIHWGFHPDLGKHQHGSGSRLVSCNYTLPKITILFNRSCTISIAKLNITSATLKSCGPSPYMHNNGYLHTQSNPSRNRPVEPDWNSDNLW